MEKEIKNLVLAIENNADILTPHTAVKQVPTATWFLIKQYLLTLDVANYGGYKVTAATARTDNGQKYHNLRITYPSGKFSAWLTDLIY